MIRLSCFGAAKQVTGSCHLVETEHARVLVDCGMFQGGRELAEENAEEFGFDPASIDVLLLTHAHLDHCGRIPLLVKRGFRGRIVCTPATRELARLVLADAAGLQEEEARRAQRHPWRRDAQAQSQPLYTLADAFHSMDFFDGDVSYGHRLDVARGVHATFVDAGHILGSASILLEIEDGESSRSVFFSGDIGNPGRPLLRDPQAPTVAPDYVVMETTYGDRDHRDWEESVDELLQAVADTHARGGNVIIPSFALERAQEVLYALAHGIEIGRLPRHLAVFLDSPMAISATEIFLRYPGCLRPQFAQRLHGDDPLTLPGLRMTRDTAESMAINTIRGGAVIMAGSGMCTGGRVRHHLKHNLPREQSSVVFVGFASQGTLARRIIDGARSVQIFGEEVPVRARVHTINGFSAHADRDELLEWHRATGAARTFLVHGEQEVMRKFASVLEGTEVVMPALHEEHEL
ncbi:MAG: MBL fold metallo-hydrolase [Betaproteobacteria bacterium]|nr:MBL fold metallo-hydrolase [Betaproteobacteria bacterium]